MIRFLSLLSLWILFACSSNPDSDTSSIDIQAEPIQAYTLNGDPLFIPDRSIDVNQSLQLKIDSAKLNWERDPSEMNFIWYGRRVAYTNRYNEAISIYSSGIEKYPQSYKLYRHRGHRWLSIRKFDEAINDFSEAAKLIGDRDIQTEPDGMPNSQNIPLSNTQFNIYYHLGLAYYLKADWSMAEIAYRQCMDYSVNNDLLVATADWLYMTLKKQGKEEEAALLLDSISNDMKIIENDSYFRRLLMYKGELLPEELFNDSSELDDITIATQGYGVGNYHLQKGDTALSIEIFNKVISGKSWSAFGFIAAEAELTNIDN